MAKGKVDMETFICELDEQLQLLGAELTMKELRMCYEVCVRRKLTAEMFAESWVAFWMSRKKMLKPNSASVLVFEKHMDEKIVAAVAAAAAAINVAPSRLDSCEDDSLAAYRRVQEVDNSPSVCVDPPSSVENNSKTQSTKYSLRTNSKEILLSFGNEDMLRMCSWKTSTPETCTVVKDHISDDVLLNANARYGFELLQTKAKNLDYNIEYVSKCILIRANIREFSPINAKSQVPVNVMGRIECDGDGRLNPKCVLLQGTWGSSLGHNIPVDLSLLSNYSLFPGQVVVMRGLNQGDKFIVHKVYSDGEYKPCRSLSLSESLKSPLNIIVASGPFALPDNMSYDPLNDLIEYIVDNKPHAVFLIGPFMDANHRFIYNNLLTETYNTFFEKLVEKVMKKIELSCPHTKVLFVSSSKDVFSNGIYPSPPYIIKNKFKNMEMINDPSIVNISGVDIGVTSSDVLMHLSGEEIASPIQDLDKFSRLAEHLLRQQSFYPLWPPHLSMYVDTESWSQYSYMKCTPHILIVPSDFRYFIKEVKGCTVINPERLVKGMCGGTFLRLQVNHKVKSNDKIICQIVRI